MIPVSGQGFDKARHPPLLTEYLPRLPNAATQSIVTDVLAGPQAFE
jgi:hypothetical protein